MTNPFDDQDARYLVLVNAANQYSLWPRRIPVPDGWQTAQGPASRAACLDHVVEHWTALSPPRPSGSTEGVTLR